MQAQQSNIAEKAGAKWAAWCSGNVYQAARRMGVKPATLHDRLRNSRPVRLDDFVAACQWQIENQGKSELLEALTLDLQPITARARPLSVETDARRAISAAADQIGRLMAALDDNQITKDEAIAELPETKRTLAILAQLVADLTARASEATIGA